MSINEALQRLADLQRAIAERQATAQVGNYVPEEIPPPPEDPPVDPEPEDPPVDPEPDETTP